MNIKIVSINQQKLVLAIQITLIEFKVNSIFLTTHSKFVKKCKYILRKISEISKTSVVEFFFNQTVGINSRPATSSKRNLHQRRFPVNILGLCSTFTEKSNMSSVFEKNCEFFTTRQKIYKTLPHHRIYSQKIILRQLIFGMYFKYNLWRGLFTAELQSVRFKSVMSLKYRTLLVHSLHCLCIDDFMKVF